MIRTGWLAFGAWTLLAAAFVVWTERGVAPRPLPLTRSLIGNEEMRDRAKDAIRTGRLADGRDLLTSLALQGDPEARALLGSMQGQGQGGPTDDRAAFENLTTSCDAGQPVGCRFKGLGLVEGKYGFDRDPVSGKALLVRTSERGDVPSLTMLAKLHHDGAPGVAKDVVQAATYAKAAADQGSARGMFQYGQSLVAGEGVRRDRAQGLVWIRRAADSGDAEAGQWLVRYGNRPQDSR